MKTKHLILCIAASALFVGCEDKGGTPASEDSVNPDKIEAPVEGLIDKVIIVKTSEQWTAAITAGQEDGWVHIKDGSGDGEGTFIVTVDPNEGYSTRSTSIDVKTGGSPITIPVTQVQLGPMLTLGENSKTVDSGSHSFDISVTANGEWIAEITGSGSDSVLSIAAGTETGIGDGSFTVKVSSNSSLGSRTGTVKVYLKESVTTSGQFELTQNGLKNMLISPLDNYEDELVIDLTASWQATCDAGWVEVLTPSGTAGGKLRVKTSANSDITASRKAEIKITSSAGNFTINACQPPLAIRYTGTDYDIYWATLAVDEPGTFAAKPYDRGRYYRFNEKVGYTSIAPITPAFPADTKSEDSDWTAENDPCPEGWRVVKFGESEYIRPEGRNFSVVKAGEKGARYGGVFMSLEEGVHNTATLYDYPAKCIFLPNSTYIASYSGKGDYAAISGDWEEKTYGTFWTTKQEGAKAARSIRYGMHIEKGPQFSYAQSMKSLAMQIRCVKEVN